MESQFGKIHYEIPHFSVLNQLNFPYLLTRRLLEKRMRKTTVFTAFCKNRSNLIDLIQKSNSVHHYFSTSVVQMIKKKIRIVN